MVASYFDVEYPCGVTFTNLPLPVRPSGAKYICRYKYVSVTSKSAGDGSVGKSFIEKNYDYLPSTKQILALEQVRSLFVASTLASKNQ
jgi:hypothetical protein